MREPCASHVRAMREPCVYNAFDAQRLILRDGEVIGAEEGLWTRLLRTPLQF